MRRLKTVPETNRILHVEIVDELSPIVHDFRIHTWQRWYQIAIKGQPFGWGVHRGRDRRLAGRSWGGWPAHTPNRWAGRLYAGRGVWWARPRQRWQTQRCPASRHSWRGGYEAKHMLPADTQTLRLKPLIWYQLNRWFRIKMLKFARKNAENCTE